MSQPFLADAGRPIPHPPDYHATTLDQIARLAVPALADLCIIDLIEDESLRPVAIAHEDLETERRLRRSSWTPYPLDAPEVDAILRAVRSGRPTVVPQVTDGLLAGFARVPEDAALLDGHATTSLLVAPLAARGRTLGTIRLLSSRPGRRFGPAELARAGELALSATLAIEVARLDHEASAALRVQNELLVIAAHELRTPITSLLGFAQLAIDRLDRVHGLEPDPMRRALWVIERQSIKVARVVKQLVDVARIEAGGPVVDGAVADLTPLVEGVAAAARLTTARHTIVVHVPTRLQARGDAWRLELLLTNLLDNAIHYSPDGGPIEIAVCQPAAGSLRLAITDHGPGIPPGQRPWIFDRLRHDVDRDRRSGMGLGLYICRRIVELHAGSLEAEFPPGGGTRIIVTLPATPHQDPASADDRLLRW